MPKKTKKYNIICADPPWSYNDKASAGKRGAAYQYDLMTQKDIQALPVQSIAHENCVCLMWATAPLMDECIATMRAWGFEYKTFAYVWVKTNKVRTDTFFIGMGNKTRSNAEFVLLGIKGRVDRIDKGMSQIIETFMETADTQVIRARVRKNSQKPNVFYTKVEKLFGDIPRCELFARETREGWDVFGNEIDGKDIRDALLGK